jgi:hypothetical protein
LQEWKHILEFGGTAHTKAIVANLKFCRDVIDKPYKSQTPYEEGIKWYGQLYRFKGKKLGW